MRLREIIDRLETSLPALRGVSSSGSTTGLMEVNGLVPVRAAVTSLGLIPALNQTARELASHRVISSFPDNKIIIPSDEAKDLLRRVQALASEGNVFLHLLKSALPDDDALTLSVRLPDTSSLSDLSNIVGELSDIFSQALQPAGLGGARVAGFDTGSMWIQVTLDTAESLALIVSLAISARWIAARRRENRDQQENARKIAEKDEAVILDKLQERFEKSLRDDAIRRLTREGMSNEEVQRLGIALDKYLALQERGAAIVPSLSAPQEIRTAYAIDRTMAPGMQPPQLPPWPAKEGGGGDDEP